jgi:peptide/nickel transport system substrate-binding protein
VGPIEAVEEVDSLTVKFKLNSAYAEFPVELTKRWGRIVMEGAGESLANTPAGSGPFILEEWIVGSHVSVKANPNYWDPAVPGVDEVIVKFFPDPIAAVNAFETGEIDILGELPQDLANRVKGMSEAVVEEIAAGSWIPMIMRTDTPPFDNPKVRLAVKHCIDRQGLVNMITEGHGVPANDHPIPPNNPYYLNVPVREQDYEKAKALLAEAGYPNGFEMELVAATDRPLRAKMALAIQQMCAPAGINFKVRTVSYDVYIAQVYKKGGCYIGWWGFRPTADGNTFPFFTCDGSWNEYVYCNDELDSILRDARGELDEDKRMGLYQQAQSILTDEGPALIPAYTSFISAWKTYVKGYSVHPMTWFDHLRWVTIEK